MKSVLALVVLVASVHASAAIVSVDCNYAAYQEINHALENVQVMKGAELQAEVESLLTQEMGPECKRLVDTVARISIPGYHVNKYQLFAPGYVYTIEIGSQVESAPTQWVNLYKAPTRR